MTVADRTYDEARQLSAGIRYLEHKETVREALGYRLDELLDKRHDAYFAKHGPSEDAWRRQIPRRRLAADIRDVRAALRALP